MKCVCGYEYRVGKHAAVVIGDKPFNKCQVCASEHWLDRGFIQTGINLFVCPKCKTMRCGEG